MSMMNICGLWKTFQNTLNEVNRVSILDPWFKIVWGNSILQIHI